MTSTTSQTSKSWDKYWQGTRNNGAFTNGGVSHPAIRSFWIELFTSVKSSYAMPRALDIASGNGAVLEAALDAFDGIPIELTSLDVSETAIKNIHSRFPQVKGVIANADSIPEKSGSFDVVCSQYGVEYAGHNAILESARLVADSGLLALLMHCDSSAIDVECQQSLDAIEQTQASSFIPLAIDMFDAGFKSVKGADRAPYEQAANKLAPAITKLESIMRQYGPHVAGDTISRLYNDVGQIHQRIQHYSSEEVITWLNNMHEELNAYGKRMSSMCSSAITPSTFDKVKSDVSKLGFTIETADKLYVPDNRLPMAWVLIAKKTS